MKAMIIPIPVERSGLVKSPMGRIKMITEMFNNVNQNISSWQPILPVLVSDEPVSEPVIGETYYIIGFNRLEKCTQIKNRWMFETCYLNEEKDLVKKLITVQTEELYEDLASGKLEFNVWYEFAVNILSNTSDRLSRPLRVVEKSAYAKALDSLSPEELEQHKKDIELEEAKPIVTEDQIREVLDMYNAFLDVEYQNAGYDKDDINTFLANHGEWLLSKLENK